MLPEFFQKDESYTFLLAQIVEFTKKFASRFKKKKGKGDADSFSFTLFKLLAHRQVICDLSWRSQCLKVRNRPPN